MGIFNIEGDLENDADLKSHGAVKINSIYVIALIVSLIYLFSGLLFIQYIEKLSRQETLGYIQEATRQTKFAIEEHIQEEFDTLLAAAIVAQDRNLLVDDEVLHLLLKGLGAHNAYVQIGFADTSGQAVWIDQYDREHRANLSAEGFIQRALTGENALSRVRYDEVSRLDIHYYAVPIFDGNSHSIEGVLFAADPQDELRIIVNHSLHVGKGLAHIINNQGDYMVKSDSPLVVGVGNNIFQVRTPLDAATQQEIRDNMAARRAGYFIKAFYGENRLVAYEPLDINDWYVFYAVPEGMVSAGLKNVTVGAVATVSIATMVFIFFIVLIHRINTKNRNALETLAFVDPVTGRRNFHKFLRDAQEILKNADGVRYAVCYCDIKGFRYINDLYGRDVGNRMLRYLADFQNRISQEGEVSGRICEDAFVALRKYQSRQEIELRFEGTAQQLAIFPETFSRGYKAELYGGAYLLDPADGNLTLNDMLDRAIAAHEEVKLWGGTKRFGIYSREMREQKLWEAEVESQMGAALENNEFRVYLQPKIDIQHGDRVLGAEALVRWSSPEKGLIPPGRFIELFEKNGFIVELDKFVFERACRYYKEAVLDGDLPAFVLSVNVSRLGLMQPDFMRAYTSIKEAYCIPDGHIELEFTESLVFGDHALFKTIVAECKRNGFLCSMDDFGAGYSSLNILKSIHVDVLKLDRQFFLYGNDGERGQELVKNIIAMAKALHMKTVAEGVDEKSQVEQLRTMGCDAIQGYVFAKPMPAEDFGQFMKSWAARLP